MRSETGAPELIGTSRNETFVRQRVNRSGTCPEPAGETYRPWSITATFNMKTFSIGHKHSGDIHPFVHTSESEAELWGTARGPRGQRRAQSSTDVSLVTKLLSLELLQYISIWFDSRESFFGGGGSLCEAILTDQHLNQEVVDLSGEETPLQKQPKLISVRGEWSSNSPTVHENRRHPPSNGCRSLNRPPQVQVGHGPN